MPNPPAPPPPAPPPPPSQAGVSQTTVPNPVPVATSPQSAPMVPQGATTAGAGPGAVPVAVGTVPPVASVVETAATSEQDRAAAEAEARLVLLSTSDVSQANAVTAIVGDSGSGKTSLLCTAVEYCWETFHRTAVFYAIDLGGFGSKLIRLAKMGIVQIYNVRTHVEAFETMELISMGYFPEKILDPITGFADPHVRLIPPQVRRWLVYCGQGHVIATVENRRHLDSFQRACPVCKGAPVTMNTWGKVEEVVAISPGFKHRGLYIYDSGTSAEDWIMEDMAGRSARDEYLGDKNQLKGAPAKLVSGDMVFGSNSMPHYGFAQNRMPSWIANTRRIPRQVVPALWTFLEQRGTDEGNLTVFCPKIAGNAKGPEVPSWVGNCLNATKEWNTAGKLKHRLWLETHSSPNEGNIPHLAKHRGDPGTMPAYLEDPDGEPAFSQCSLKYFFIRMDDALKLSLASAADQYPDAPALQPFTDDREEEIISTQIASVSSAVVRHSAPQGPVAGSVPYDPSRAGVPAGVPAPPIPVGYSGVPVPPAGGGIPAVPMATERPPMPAAAPVAQVVSPTAPSAPPPPTPAQVAPPTVAPQQPAPPAAQSVAPPLVAAVALPVVQTPTVGVAPPAAAAPHQGGAPVRPPATAAIQSPGPKARAGRPAVPAAPVAPMAPTPPAGQVPPQ